MQANHDETPDMSSYQDVLSLAQQLSPNEQIQLIEALTPLIHQPVEVEGSDEVISVAESSVAELLEGERSRSFDRRLEAKTVWGQSWLIGNMSSLSLL